MLADHWCEHGDPDRGTFVHAACEGLVAHTHALLAEHGLHWFAPLWEHGFHPDRVALERGFTRPLVLAPDSELARHPELFRISPVVFLRGEVLDQSGGAITARATRMTAAGPHGEVSVRGPGWSDDPAVLQREYDILGRFASPHLMQVLALAQDERGSMLVLPRRGDAYDTVPDGAARVGHELALAIAEAHRCGVVHGRIVPSAIQRTPAGLVLDDFAEATCDLSRVDVDHGIRERRSVRYLSPEQTRGERIDGATDVWAVAMLVAERALGRHPVAAGNDLDALIAIRDLRFERLDPATPLGAILARVLVRDPAARPTAGALADQLAALSTRRDERP